MLIVHVAISYLITYAVLDGMPYIISKPYMDVPYIIFFLKIKVFSRKTTNYI